MPQQPACPGLQAAAPFCKSIHLAERKLRTPATDIGGAIKLGVQDNPLSVAERKWMIDPE